MSASRTCRLFFVHLAAKTERLRFGCGFNVTTMWHPLRLAEDFATADILTGGRVIFGVGRGYHTREVETLGGVLIDGDANRDMFEEQVEIVLRSFHEESFRHDGKYYTLPPRVPYRGYELDEITLVPRPVNQPVECWQPIVSAQPRGLDFMAKHGIKGIVGGGSALMAERPIVAFKEAWERAGHDVEIGENLCIGLNFHIAETKEKAIREATPFFEEHVKMFAPLGMVPMKPEQLQRVSERGDWAEMNIPTLERAVEAGSWYCGPPEGFIDYLESLQAKYPGLEDVNVQSSMGTPLFGDARAARTLRQGGDGALPRTADRQGGLRRLSRFRPAPRRKRTAPLSRLHRRQPRRARRRYARPAAASGAAADGAVSRKPI